MSPRRRLGSPDEHDRARELASLRLDEPLPDDDDRWLAEHLDACAPCRVAADDYEAQRGLLRALRDAPPDPPRDLWARTAAAIEADGASRPHRSRQPRRIPAFRGIPMAPVTALLAVAVVIGAALLNGAGLLGPGRGPGGSPLATPIAIAAGEVQVLTRGADGSVALSTRRYDQVCPIGASTCGGSVAGDGTTLATRLADLGNVDAYLSPTQDSIVVMQRGSTAGGVFVVPVRPASTPSPTASSAGATPTPSTGSSSPVATTQPTTTGQTPPASPAGSAGTGASPSVSAGPSPSPTVAVTPAPDGTIQIVRDVIVVGSVSGYSPDGTQFAFSARPADGSLGPDVYVWNTAESQARRVTSDHASIFASWNGNRLLVSRVVNGTPSTGLLDAVTGTEEIVATSGAWRPVTAPDGRTAVWWDGSVVPTVDGFGWLPATGRLVLGPWSASAANGCPASAPSGAPAASPSGAPSGVRTSAPSAAPSAAPTSAPSPCPTVVPTAAPASTPTATPSTTVSGSRGNGQHVGPSGSQRSPQASPPVSGINGPSGSPRASGEGDATSLQILATSPLRDWQVLWDESGSAVGLWVSAAAPGEAGRLSLYAIDPVSGVADLARPLLADAPAFEGFSLRGGRLTWSAPTASGDATVEVLVWSGEAVGQLEMRVGRGATLVR